MITFWTPEAPSHPGLYANLTDRNPGKISDGFAVSTRDIHSARQFATREACQAWCDENPKSPFVPVEHAFADKPAMTEATTEARQ